MTRRIETAFSCLFAALMLVSTNACSQRLKQYTVTNIKGSMITIDSTYDKHPDAKACAILKPYKQKVNKLMTTVIGTAAMRMERLTNEVPEGLLSNLIADVLRDAGAKETGRPCDLGLINRGGIRTILAKGPITVANVYEIMPFENTLCVLTLNGDQLLSLLKNIARTGGQGVSGVNMIISHDGKLVSATVEGKAIEPTKSYTLGTINFLAEGNDGMTTLASKDIPRINYDHLVVRDMFIHYVKAQTAAGKEITARIEGRITFAK